MWCRPRVRVCTAKCITSHMGGDSFDFDVYLVAPLRRGTAYIPRVAERRAIWRAFQPAVTTPCGRLRLLALATFAHTRWEDIEPHLLLQDVTWVVGVPVPVDRHGVDPVRLSEAVTDFQTALRSAGSALAEWIDVDAVRVCAATNLIHKFRYMTDAELAMDDGDDDEDGEDGEDGGAGCASCASATDGGPDDAAVDRAIFRGS